MLNMSSIYTNKVTAQEKVCGLNMSYRNQKRLQD